MKDVERTQRGNSPVERLVTIERRDHVGVALLEMEMHRCGAAILGRERSVALIAGHLSGGCVAIRFGEVTPNQTSGPTASDLTACWGGQSGSRRSDESRLTGK